MTTSTNDETTPEPKRVDLNVVLKPRPLEVILGELEAKFREHIPLPFKIVEILDDNTTALAEIVPTNSVMTIMKGRLPMDSKYHITDDPAKMLLDLE